MAKPSAWRRGYDGDHRKLRARLAPEVATGLVNCWRCGLPILPGQPWDLGHDDNDRSKYMGPEHQECNRATKSLDRRDPPPRSATWWRAS